MGVSLILWYGGGQHEFGYLTEPGVHRPGRRYVFGHLFIRFHTVNRWIQEYGGSDFGQGTCPKWHHKDIDAIVKAN